MNGTAKPIGWLMTRVRVLALRGGSVTTFAGVLLASGVGGAFLLVPLLQLRWEAAMTFTEGVLPNRVL